MKVCVTGSEGYIGRALVRALKEAGDVVLGVDLRAEEPADIRAGRTIGRVNAWEPDVVVNLAGISGEARCREDEGSAQSVNANSVYFWRAGLPKSCLFIQASSASVIANKGYGETPYAASKAEAENNLYLLRKAGPSYTLRFGTVFGWNGDKGSMRWDTPFNRMCWTAAKEGKVYVSGPKKMRPWVSLGGVVDFIMHLICEWDFGRGVGWVTPLPVCEYNLSLGHMARIIAGAGVWEGRPEVVEVENDGDSRDYVMPALLEQKGIMFRIAREMIEEARRVDAAV